MRISDWSSDVCSSDLLPIVDDLCGLPFQEWRDGIRQKREAKEAAELKRIDDAKESRRRNFAIAAKNALKDEAETWLASTVVDGVPITEWACGSDDLTCDRKYDVEGKRVSVRVD